MVVEVMGRYAGWIALYSAIAGGADICLIPEIHYNLEKVAKEIELKKKKFNKKWVYYDARICLCKTSYESRKCRFNSKEY